ncbi:MAG TPA: universal stress protein [Verrucomicrobia bacterium]|nr:MAG: universal stress protein [Lentisphaerae bacterium GWF2_57_35]HBA82981.1 universal stress protein [Verrucomicrobiota bacterium]
MNVLVAIDFSEASPRLFTEVRKWAGKLDADFWFIHVAEPDPAFLGYEMGPQTVRDQMASKYRKEHQQLQQEVEALKKSGLKATALLVQGSTVDVILQEASKLNADMIVMGSHGHGPVHNLLVGSVSEGVLQRAACPVLVIPTHKR